jgi:uncharacterized protein (TIGR03089 family)
MEGFAGLVGRGVARHGDRPLLTWYDDERSERVELSWRTFGNWVAKVANLLAGELGVAPGDRVGAVLVDHWQAATVLAGCWLAGAGVVAVDPGAAPHAKRAALAGCEAAFVREEWVAEVDGLPGPGRLVALTADLLGRGDRDLGGALPFARAVAAMPDRFAGEAADPDPAVDGAGMAALLADAAALAGEAGLGDGDRLLSGLGLLDRRGAVAGLLAPLLAGAGVVLQRAPDPASLWRRAAQERVTVAVLDPGQAAALPPADPGLDLRVRALLAPAPDGWRRLRAGPP